MPHPAKLDGSQTTSRCAATTSSPVRLSSVAAGARHKHARPAAPISAQNPPPRKQSPGFGSSRNWRASACASAPYPPASGRARRRVPEGATNDASCVPSLAAPVFGRSAVPEGLAISQLSWSTRSIPFFWMLFAPHPVHWRQIFTQELSLLHSKPINPELTEMFCALIMTAMAGSPSFGLVDPSTPDCRNSYLGVYAINVFVRDLDKSLRFYLDQLGFSLAFDVRLQSGQRWVGVAPPHGTAVLTLVAPEPDSYEYKLIGQPTPVAFVAEDVVATYAQWRSRGVRFRHVPRLRRVKYEQLAADG